MRDCIPLSSSSLLRMRDCIFLALLLCSVMSMAAAVAIAALAGLILAWHCCRPRWGIRLMWTGGMPLPLGHLRRVASEQRSTLDSSSEAEEEEGSGVTGEDLKMLFAYIDEKDGGPPWQLMMDRATSTLTFRAWRRDPKFGPTQYRSQAIFENMEPELLRDFFWEDEFRTKWDDTLLYFRILQEYPQTGTVIIHWIRKFPLCGTREYIIGRRMWVSRSTYYCVSKSIPFQGIPRRARPRRVDLYYSSWRIREVESQKGHSTACEVLLFHSEDIGIQKMLAKVVVQRGMWGLVEKLEKGLHSYQMSRLNGSPPSRYTLLARTATQIPDTNLLLLDEPYLPDDQFEEDEGHGFTTLRRKLKWLLAGGILIACGFKRRELGKGLLFYILQGIDNIYSSKGDNKVSFFSNHAEIAKQVPVIGSASKSLNEMIQRGKSTATRHILREQSPIAGLLARITARVLRKRRWWEDPWPKLFKAAIKIFGL